LCWLTFTSVGQISEDYTALNASSPRVNDFYTARGFTFPSEVWGRGHFQP